MTIKARLALTLGALLLVFLGTFFALQQMERAEADVMLNRARDERAQLLNHWLDATARALPQFATETAQSPEFAKLLTSSDANAAREKVRAELRQAGMASLWVIATDGSVRFSATTDSATPPGLPANAAEVVAIARETPSPRFFADQGNELLELCLRRLQPKGAMADAWVLVARRWDDGQRRALAALTEAEVALLPARALSQPPAMRGHVVLLRPFNDINGHTLRTLRLDYALPEIQREREADWRRAAAYFAFALFVVAAFTFAIQRWVVQPLAQIGTSLARNDPAPVRALGETPGEFGQLARLVTASFAHRAQLQAEIAARAETQAALERSEAALRRNLEERARLGRDLHDGVIQSLYAAGMGLAGVRTLLQPDQVEAAARLEQTRSALNETIHDVRNFIIGLEPEALKLQTFAQAVGALIELLRSLRPFDAQVQIDESLAARLSLAQRVNALQIAREAISNALRHGAATRVSVALRPQGEFAEFEVTDNGTGFNPAAVDQGRGLASFAARAHELGATLNVQSQPGAGARVQLLFSIQPL